MVSLLLTIDLAMPLSRVLKDSGGGTYSELRGLFKFSGHICMENMLMF